MIPANPDVALLESRQIDPRDPRPPLVQAVRIGLYDEYRARAFYGRVVDRFGPLPVFVNIRGSEARHIQALTRLCQRYAVPPPVDDWAGRLTVPPSVTECCALGVAGEIANGAMYDQFLAWPMPPDAAGVFASLRAASWHNHLTAFRRCATAQGRQGPGRRLLPWGLLALAVLAGARRLTRK